MTSLIILSAQPVIVLVLQPLSLKLTGFAGDVDLLLQETEHIHFKFFMLLFANLSIQPLIKIALASWLIEIKSDLCFQLKLLLTYFEILFKRRELLALR